MDPTRYLGRYPCRIHKVKRNGCGEECLTLFPEFCPHLVLASGTRSWFDADARHLVDRVIGAEPPSRARFPKRIIPKISRFLYLPFLRSLAVTDSILHLHLD